MNNLLKNSLDKITKYCEDYDVEKLYAFGSITTDNFSDNSDIDFLIKFGKIPYETYADNYFKLHELFEQFFNRKVDLVTENSLSNPYFIKKVNQTKIVLYER
ncbi:MAG: nucleotidyltransferase domain-containing protein [Desulfobacterales bacterium]|nr:nucleotidyltransferase domain-containing protein [Desulfobacterales bacterium]